jgi:hypothetical protein
MPLAGVELPTNFFPLSQPQAGGVRAAASYQLVFSLGWGCSPVATKRRNPPSLHGKTWRVFQNSAAQVLLSAASGSHQGEAAK